MGIQTQPDQTGKALHRDGCQTPSFVSEVLRIRTPDPLSVQREGPVVVGAPQPLVRSICLTDGVASVGADVVEGPHRDTVVHDEGWVWTH